MMEKLTSAGFVVLLAMAACPGAAEEPMPKQKKSQSPERMLDPLAARVRKAFESARAGDLQPSAELAQAGPSIVPHVTPFVKDSSEDVRRQAVAVLAAVGGKTALAPLVQALNDASPDIQDMAAVAIYDGFAPRAVTAESGASAALRKAARAGAKSPAVPLLLSYFPGAQTKAALGELRERDQTAEVRMRSWSPPVPVSLPVSMALSRLGDGKGRKELLAAIDKGDQGELEFLLEALREVDSPEVLHAIARTLDDTRPVENRVPAGVEPRPRLCDVAVGAFVTRLKLKVTFEINSAIQYSPDQIEQVRAAIRSAIPQ